MPLITIYSALFLLSCERKDDSVDRNSELGLVSYQEDILPIIETRCSVCHDGTSTPNWADFSTAINGLSNIRNRVFELSVSDPLSMPANNNQTGMTDAERQLMADWVDQGGTENLNDNPSY